MSNQIDHARHVLEAGADVNSDCDGWPPLHCAANYGNLPAVQLMLEYGADVSSETGLGQKTALHMIPNRYISKSIWPGTSYSVQEYEIFKLLLESGASIDARDIYGATPLFYALRFSDMKTVQLCMDNGADITAVDIKGKTALHYVVGTNQHVNRIGFVLEQGFHPDCGDNDDHSALHYVVDQGSPEACEFLLKRGAMVNRKSCKTNHTPLSRFILKVSERFHEYCHMRVAPMIEILLEYGAEITDKIGNLSILEVAAAEHIHECIKVVLMKHVAKMAFLGVGADLLTIIENKNCYKKYYQRCFEELQFMKTTKLYDNVSIFNIFMGSEKKISGYARNEELVGALEKGNYEMQLPMYFPSLKKRFYPKVDKHRLRVPATKIVSNIFKFNDPFHPVNQKIFNYLSDDDLKFLEM